MLIFQFNRLVVSDSLGPHGLHPLFITNSRSLLKLKSIALVMPSNDLNLCCPFLLPLIFASIKVFSSESVLHIRWPKYWRFSFSLSPSSEYSGLISFMIDWFDLLAVQGTLKSLLQHHSINSSMLSLLYSPIIKKKKHMIFRGHATCFGTPMILSQNHIAKLLLNT